MHFEAGLVIFLHPFQNVRHKVECRHHQRVCQHPLMSRYLNARQLVGLKQAESVAGAIADRLPVYFHLFPFHWNRQGIG